MKSMITIKHPRRCILLGALALTIGGYYGEQSRSRGDEKPAESVEEDEADIRTLEGRIIKAEDAPVYTGESNTSNDGDKRTVNLELQYLTVKKCKGPSVILLNQLSPVYLNLDAEITYRTFKPDEFKIEAMNSYSRLIDEYIRMGYITNDGSPAVDILGIVLPGGIKYR